MSGRNYTAILITVGVAAYFWAQWILELRIYRAETLAITETLRDQGLMRINIYPESRDPKCYRYNAIDDIRQVSGTICIGDE